MNELKFGDVLVNLEVNVDSIQRVAIYVKRERGYISVTDGHNRFWNLSVGFKGVVVVGNIFEGEVDERFNIDKYKEV